MLQNNDSQVTVNSKPNVVVPMIKDNGHQIYESTLVNQLNGNLFLSKDRLTRVKNSIYFNNTNKIIYSVMTGAILVTMS